MGIIEFIERYTIPEYIAAVIIAVDVLKIFVKLNLNPKWITLAVAVVFAIIHVVFFLDEMTSYTWWKYVTSLGIDVLLYECWVKSINDFIISRSVKGELIRCMSFLMRDMVD